MHTDIIRDMRKRCRLAMNGVTSSSMRQKGMAYKLNFGLVIQQIKDIARHYDADARLANTLWKEDVRELKILATILYPLSAFTEHDAEMWVKEIPNQEIREQVCANLFQNLAFANKLIYDWKNSREENIRTTAYWLLARLSLSKTLEPVQAKEFKYILDDIISSDIFLRNAAILALKHIGRQSKEEGDTILQKLAAFKDEEDPLKREIYDSLSFEFEYYQ
ncbi:DNA alkylation repair protein [Dysgonomonas sp. 511]|uniref:DNA alkylation repair protein n=1 Tax=Dysgonomonas sp. 511 TaxID=2302930 RepID=UPI0013CFCAE9|nr:DNA alkylation repair protein [Dysgonomonas sp. 511]NDV77506.1 hypothetical protein [Dysgonomonas sp. 511]